MYHAACKVEFQPLTRRLYSQLADVFQLFIKSLILVTIQETTAQDTTSVVEVSLKPVVRMGLGTPAELRFVFPLLCELAAIFRHF